MRNVSEHVATISLVRGKGGRVCTHRERGVMDMPGNGQTVFT